MMRLLFAIAVALLAGLVALPGMFWPLFPEQSLTIDVAAMNAPYGRLVAVEEGAFQVSNEHGDSALQTATGLDVVADDLTMLRYRMQDYPGTLELVFLWRRADDLQTLHSATIPAPRGGDQAFALTQLPDWRGRVVEVGFGQIPVALQTPAGTPFPPFVIEGVRLESPSLVNALRAQFDNLFAWRPWAQRSINSLGRELSETPRQSAAIPVVASLAAFTVMCLILFRGRALPPIAIAVALAWLLLDFSWQRQLHAQNRLTESAVKAAPFADVEIAGLADRFREWYRLRGRAPKVLVLAPSTYTTYRLIWHLLPLDVAIWNVALGRVDRIAPGTLILLPARLVDQVIGSEPSNNTLGVQGGRRVHALDDWLVMEVQAGGAAP